MQYSSVCRLFLLCHTSIASIETFHTSFSVFVVLLIVYDSNFVLKSCKMRTKSKKKKKTEQQQQQTEYPFVYIEWIKTVEHIQCIAKHSCWRCRISSSISIPECRRSSLFIVALSFLVLSVAFALFFFSTLWRLSVTDMMLCLFVTLT